jgi:8-oxo-dGTP pyrophosphatase MutT (NUDIX family)
LTGAVRIVEVDRLECLVVDYEWEFERLHENEIHAHWVRRRASNPALFDGPVLLARRAELRRGVQGERIFGVDFFEVRFSRFLAWRDFGFPDREVYNCFAMPALRTSDGAFLLGEMGPRHSCAGQLYFPAGTPDRQDVSGGRVNLDGSIIRELAEETGIVVDERMFAPQWRLVFDSQHIACMKIIDWPAPARDVEALVERHIANEAEPELARGYMLSRKDQLSDQRLPAFMAAFLDPLLSP